MKFERFSQIVYSQIFFIFRGMELNFCMIEFDMFLYVGEFQRFLIFSKIMK